MATTKIPQGYSVETTTIRYRNVKNPLLGHQKIVTLVRYPDGKVVRFTERLSKGEAVRQAIDLRRREEARGSLHGVTERDARRSRKGKGRRDPVTLPKTVQTKVSAIKRSIAKIAESTNLDARERHDAGEKVGAAIDRLEKYTRAEGIDIGDLGGSLWRSMQSAKQVATENRQRYLNEQAAHYSQKAREAQPVPGTYEHELALMKGGYRRDSSRAKRSTRRVGR